MVRSSILKSSTFDARRKKLGKSPKNACSELYDKKVIKELPRIYTEASPEPQKNRKSSRLPYNTNESNHFFTPTDNLNFPMFQQSHMQHSKPNIIIVDNSIHNERKRSKKQKRKTYIKKYLQKALNNSSNTCDQIDNSSFQYWMQLQSQQHQQRNFMDMMMFSMMMNNMNKENTQDHDSSQEYRNMMLEKISNNQYENTRLTQSQRDPNKDFASLIAQNNITSNQADEQKLTNLNRKIKINKRKLDTLKKDISHIKMEKSLDKVKKDPNVINNIPNEKYILPQNTNHLVTFPKNKIDLVSSPKKNTLFSKDHNSIKVTPKYEIKSNYKKPISNKLVEVPITDKKTIEFSKESSRISEKTQVNIEKLKKQITKDETKNFDIKRYKTSIEEITDNVIEDKKPQRNSEFTNPKKAITITRRLKPMTDLKNSFV